MDGPVTELSPCNLGTPKRRSVRRKLVQSTLFPHKIQEHDDKADETDEKNCLDDQQGEEEAHCCASENKKKRKSKGRITPRTKNSKQRDTQTQNSTPKKKLSPNGLKGASSRQMSTDLAQIDMLVPNLRLEAKMLAEENLRVFAGRQIHPFFSSCKVGKKFKEPAESEHGSCTVKRKEEEVINCAPIHVFENIQDDPSALDWRNWTFWGETANANCGPESSVSSDLEGFVEPLNFDKLPSTFYPSGASTFQNALSCSDQPSVQPQNLQEILPENSAALASGQTMCLQTPEAIVDLDLDTEQAGIFRKSDTVSQSRFLQESMRSYYHSCEHKGEGSLWTYKYKPTKAFEVCGNDESVNFLRDWLHLWHGRHYQSRKDSSNRNKSEMQGDDNDYTCSQSDYDSEDIAEEDSLVNVLLITGPIGSGKSAAVYACAQEEGFEVLELNASDCRNGTAVKQYFGDTLGSHGFKRLLEHTVNSQKKTTNLSPDPALPSNKAADELNQGVVELIPISDDEAHNLVAISQRLLGKKNAIRFDEVQTLILVEDVDILFPEDRGCIAAIQQIAETAKGPIILTSNSNNPGLPDNFNRLHVSFSLPLPKDLLCHLYTVCITEGVNIHPFVLEKFIQSCDGDIRKTIMHLQFWFQSRRFRKDRKAQTVYGALPFDLDVGHQILPKIMPWDFPSQLSELIEKEVTKTVTITKEKSSLQGLVEAQLNINERQNDSDVEHMGTDYIETKKVEMLERNGSIMDCSELETYFHAISEFSNSSGTPVASSKRKVQRKLVVMSSDSEDEDLNHGHTLDICNDAKKGQSLEDNNDSPSKFPLRQNYSPSFPKLGSELDESEMDHCKYSGTADDMCLIEISNSFDISCVPESTFVPETVIVDGTETTSGAMSCGHPTDPAEVSVNNELLPFTFSVCNRLAKLPQLSDLLVSTEIPESSQKEAVQDILDENMETTPVYNVMDECSRVDFKLKSKFAEQCPTMETDVVHELWRKLRDCRTELRQHVTKEQPGAFQVVKLACGMSNLISEADLLFCNYKRKQCDILEHPALLSNEAPFSWYDEQMMVSAVAEHGFCFYAKHLSDMGSKSGCENNVDLTSELLASTTNVMALGNISRQGLTKRTNLSTGKELEVNKPINDLPKREIQTSLFNVIQSIVPARLFLALKGVAFSEYLSSLRHISSSEACRTSQGAEKMRRRRVRGTQHYLSRGTMMLSPEDISLLCEGDLYRKISLLYTGANMDSNFT